MGYPIQTQVFSVFLGTQEGIHSVALPAIYSSSGSRNLWIDKLGRAKKILGYSKQNSSAVTTNTGGSATRIRALRAYRKISVPGPLVRFLISHRWTTPSSSLMESWLHEPGMEVLSPRQGPQASLPRLPLRSIPLRGN